MKSKFHFRREVSVIFFLLTQRTFSTFMSYIYDETPPSSQGMQRQFGTWSVSASLIAVDGVCVWNNVNRLPVSAESRIQNPVLVEATHRATAAVCMDVIYGTSHWKDPVSDDQKSKISNIKNKAFKHFRTILTIHFMQHWHFKNSNSVALSTQSLPAAVRYLWSMIFQCGSYCSSPASFCDRWTDRRWYSRTCPLS